ncbi:MAG: hypothetical protein ACR2FH_07860 [Caulobacteraceae bacterium]
MLKTIFAAAALAALVAGATAAAAAPTRLTDSQYLSAVRCRALIASPALGKGDTGALDAMLKAQRQGRLGAVDDRADEMRADATRQAGHAGAQQKAQLISERDGACRAFGAGETTAAAQGAQSSGAK